MVVGIFVAALDALPKLTGLIALLVRLPILETLESRNGEERERVFTDGRLGRPGNLKFVCFHFSSPSRFLVATQPSRLPLRVQFHRSRAAMLPPSELLDKRHTLCTDNRFGATERNGPAAAPDRQARRLVRHSQPRTPARFRQAATQTSIALPRGLVTQLKMECD